MSSPLASIVIRAYNEEKHIARLLHGISAQTFRDCEIILVDSGSTDATASLVEDYGGKVVFIPPEQFTFGRALNLGIENSNGEYCIFASGHVYPQKKNWLEKLMKPFEDDDVALVYGKQRGCKKTKFSEHQIFKKWFPEGNGSYVQDHPFCNNANAAIRKEVWNTIKYDETLTGLEDLDWAQRAMDSGYKIVYAPKATVIHVHEETFSQIRNRYEREAMALKQIRPQLDFNFVDFIYLWATNSWHDLKAAFTKQMLSGNFLDILRFRYNQFIGTYMGHKRKSGLTEQLRRRYYYPNHNDFSSDQNTIADERDASYLEVDYTKGKGCQKWKKS